MTLDALVDGSHSRALLRSIRVALVFGSPDGGTMKPIPDRPTAVVLGGAGGMGRLAVAKAADFADLGELVVADLDMAAAQGVVDRSAAHAKTKVRAASVDVTDPSALRALLGSADIVLNTTGPFYRFGVPVLRAAIGAGCHYLDICDDWEPTIEMLALDAEARERDVLAVIGMGASPGLSNLIARLACERLDEVEDLYTAWPVDAGVGLDRSTLEADADIGVSAAAIHWMQQISGEIEVVEQGELVSRQPLAPVELDYPGLGVGTGYTVGHPEPITLCERMGVRGKSANLMVLQATTAAFLQLLRDDIDAGKLSLEEAAEQLVAPAVWRQARTMTRALSCSAPGRLPFFFAFARGKRAGRRCDVGVRVSSVPAGMDGVTAIPLALGLRQLLDGALSGTGVHPPETAVDPLPILEALAPHCAPAKAGFDDLVVVTETPV